MSLFARGTATRIVAAGGPPVAAFNTEILRFAACTYMCRWAFVDRRYLRFRTAGNRDLLFQYLMTYDINRTFSPVAVPPHRLAPLQAALRVIPRPVDVPALMIALSWSYIRIARSASTKCLWMLTQRRNGGGPNNVILWDKHARDGLRRIVIGPYPVAPVRAFPPGVNPNLPGRVREYDRFCLAWEARFAHYQAAIVAACTTPHGRYPALPHSNFAERIAKYWDIPIASVRAWFGQTWFHRRVFDAALHVIDGRWDDVTKVQWMIDEWNL